MYNLLNVLSIGGKVLFILGLIGLGILLVFGLIFDVIDTYFSPWPLRLSVACLISFAVGLGLGVGAQEALPKYTEGDVHVMNQLTDKVKVYQDVHNFKQVTNGDEVNDSGVYQVINAEGKTTKFYVTNKETIKQVDEHEYKGEN